MLVFMYVVVTVWWSVGMFVVCGRCLKKVSFFSLVVLKYVVCVVDVMGVMFSVCIVRRGAVGARVWQV